METKIDITDPTNPVSDNIIKGELELKSVYFSYSKNGEYVLKDISFHVNSGETIGIIGPTGSGKSTLIKLLPRLYDPDLGEVLINGINIKEYTIESLRESIGFVPQNAKLFAGSIAENIRFGKEEATLEDMEKATNSAAASEFIEKLEDQFAHELMQGATNLSGGQKQRLSMSRAFIRQPKILVLDDSTSAIDAISEVQVQQALGQYLSDTTVFIVSSKVSSIINADRILVMEDGMIVASGTHDEAQMEMGPHYLNIIMQCGKGVLSYE